MNFIFQPFFDDSCIIAQTDEKSGKYFHIKEYEMVHDRTIYLGMYIFEKIEKNDLYKLNHSYFCILPFDLSYLRKIYSTLVSSHDTSSNSYPFMIFLRENNDNVNKIIVYFYKDKNSQDIVKKEIDVENSFEQTFEQIGNYINTYPTVQIEICFQVPEIKEKIILKNI